MPMKLQEVHPSVVHMPLTFLPAAVLADAVGTLRDDPALLQVGKWGIALAAGSALLAGFFGLVAQEEVKTREHSHKMLVTHRTLNVGVTLVASGMAVARARQERPGLGYLALGAAAVGAAVYSAYLGGHMVYTHGVGVEAADGVREGTPALKRGEGLASVRRSLDNARQGLEHAVQDAARGQIAPSLRG